MNYRQPGNSNTNKLKTDATDLSIGNIPLPKDYHRTDELPTSRIWVGEENIALGDINQSGHHVKGKVALGQCGSRSKGLNLALQDTFIINSRSQTKTCAK